MQPLVYEWMLRYVIETITFRKGEMLMPFYEWVKLYLEEDAWMHVCFGRTVENSELKLKRCTVEKEGASRVNE